MAISNTSSGFRPGVCTSTTRPEAPFNGQVIYETDTKQTLVWQGTAWVMLTDADSPPGLQLIKSQAVGTGVSSIQVTDAFSADFDNYKITYSGGVGNTTLLINMHMGTSTPANGYFSTRIINFPTSGTPVGNGVNNGANWTYAGQASTNFASVNVEVFNPFLARYTHINGPYNLDVGGGSEMGVVTGFLNNTTSYTSFTFIPSGTLTGGTIRVYGYRN